MIKKLLTIGFFVGLYTVNVFSQINFSQNIYKGGIIGVGFSPAYFEVEINGTFNLTPLPPSSTIKSAFLYAGEIGNATYFNFNFNNDNYQFNQSTKIAENFVSEVYGGESAIHRIDVTNSVSIFQNNYQIIGTESQNFSSSNRFSDFFLIIEYYNPTLNFINSLVILNDKNFDNTIIYNITEINPIMSSFDVGLSLFSGYICDDASDGEKIYLNNNLLGIFGGNDLNSGECGGPFGDFHYFNNVLFGLNGDNPDLIFQNSDLISNIKTIIPNLTNNLNLRYETNVLNNKTNSIWINFLTYETPCDSFFVNITKDTTICPNAPLQLSASGGIQYEWKSSRASDLLDLSCTTCPNPIFSGDSSRVFTVQIWNNDSCSVIRPVSIKVYDTPILGVFDLSLPDCGANNGSLNIATNKDSVVSYQLDNQNIQTEGIFNGLSKGTHTIFFTDKNGCSSDSTFSFSDTTRTNAYFKASPSYGFLPLEINFNNLSTFATNYVWSIETESINVETFSALENYTFDSSGYYFIELKAWQFDASCADSFTLKITVYDNFMYQIPNIFSPNNDGVNDVFGITGNVPISVKYLLLNRWGNVIAEGNSKSSQLDKFVSIWDGTSTGSATVSEGVYFYQVEIDLIDELFLPIIDLGQGKNKIEFPIKKEGFLQLVR